MKLLSSRARLLSGAGILAAAALAAFQIPASAQAPAVASYTAAQADRGEDAYNDNCALCHDVSLAGSAEAPGLIGGGFRTAWTSGPAIQLFAFISAAMPQQAPGSLDPAVYAEIVAYILKKNGYPAGDADFPSDMAVLADMVLPARP